MFLFTVRSKTAWCKTIHQTLKDLLFELGGEITSENPEHAITHWTSQGPYMSSKQPPGSMENKEPSGPFFPNPPTLPPALEQPCPPTAQPSNHPTLQPSSPRTQFPTSTCPAYSPPTLQPSNPPALQPSTPPARACTPASNLPPPSSNLLPFSLESSSLRPSSLHPSSI